MKTKSNYPMQIGFTGLISISAAVQLQAVQVDSELMLLIDVSGSVDATEYSAMMDGYQRAFRDASVTDAIQSGASGGIAASVVFWSGAADQQVGVDWMLINDEASANAFADQIAGTSRPFSGMTAIGSGIDYGTTLFGTETGGVDNGFQSAAQIIDVSGDGTDNNTPPDNSDRAANVRASRDASLSAGVDMINGLPIGNAGGALDQYYTDNVIGGSAGGVEAFTQAALDFNDVEGTLVKKLQREVSAGANVSNGVPEPGSITLITGALGFMLIRRKR